MKQHLPENQTRSPRLGFWGPPLLQALLLASPAIALPPAHAAENYPTNQVAAPSGTVVVPVPSPYSYDAGSLQQLDLKGNFGRYIGFTGHTVIEWPATPAQLNPGQPGTLQCRHGNCCAQGLASSGKRSHRSGCGGDLVSSNSGAAAMRRHRSGSEHLQAGGDQHPAAPVHWSGAHRLESVVPLAKAMPCSCSATTSWRSRARCNCHCCPARVVSTTLSSIACGVTCLTPRTQGGTSN